MTIEMATQVGSARIDIAYERLGDPYAPPVLLIMGLGAQLIAWPDGFCHAVIARGLPSCTEQADRIDDHGYEPSNDTPWTMMLSPSDSPRSMTS
jgi:hypothetical protein